MDGGDGEGWMVERGESEGGWNEGKGIMVGGMEKGGREEGVRDGWWSYQS